MVIGVFRAWHGTFHAILCPKKYGLIPKKCEGITRHALGGDTLLFHANVNMNAMHNLSVKSVLNLPIGGKHRPSWHGTNQSVPRTTLCGMASAQQGTDPPNGHKLQ